MALTTEQRVRRAAVKLFAAKGFHGTGIRDLAQAAKISSASLYHYMGTKEDLLVEIMRECLDRLLLAARETLADLDDPPGRLSALVTLHVMAHAAQPDETRVVDNEVAALSRAARRRVVGLRDEYEAIWAGILDEGVAAGVFDAPEPAVTRLALLEMCTGVARWYSPRGPLPLDRLAARYAQLALRMLGSPAPDGDTAAGRAREVATRVWRIRP
ncbi:TetR/AcrR family transcriptional regulator [Amycolatopsis thermophila]|uniref:AcrR family transcriptional regulator n=1 Tax=Amycolatopsis thermophila TaxID=206084 RepID=A0ABU0EUL8_9PSEU|nr:TetR/AcrR family transcriptional regulator [Amycolatopsis thermophila]MDQ0378992.1 AcrR family transcriptional regulator [Amycolatopsis thermophila]